MENATDLEDAIDGLNATINNATLSSPESTWDILSDLNFLALEAQLVLGALGIIYVGAHAALRRPPSAAPTNPRKPGQKRADDDDEERLTQGLELSDAIMFPFLAGIMLVGLYYLIQWLQDPEILNKILRWYMSTMSIVSLLSFYAHGMGLFIGLVFPKYWRGRDGKLRKVDQANRLVQICDDVGNPIEAQPTSSNPVPGALSFLTSSRTAQKAAWNFRELFTNQWVLKLYVHGMGEEKTKINFAQMISLVAAAATAFIYSWTSSPLLSNTMGYGMCYGAFLLLSPTDLCIGSVVLIGLFFYDIFMVFYTYVHPMSFYHRQQLTLLRPYMVTVATKLDVPIKLTFKAAGRKSILGLGDIVLPGILMAWALRLDLHMHYQRKVKYDSTDLKIIEKNSAGETVTRTETKHKEVKARYANVQGSWAEWLWVRGWLPFGKKEFPGEIAATIFPKTYFHATVVGYCLGMAVTLAMLLIFQQGQPALLYLVPGVLGSIYFMALVRGEMKQVWGYTEDGSIDKTDVVVDLDANGKEVKKLGKLKDGVLDTTQDGEKKDDKKKEDDEDKKAGTGEKDTAIEKSSDGKEKRKKGHKVFYLSLETPSVASD